MRWVFVIGLAAALVGCASQTAQVSPTGGKAARHVPQAPIELVNEVPGRLTQPRIRQFVASHQADLTVCYASEARIDPTLQGAVDVSWEILPEGSVSAPMLVRSTLDNAQIEECVLRTVRGWRFPASESQTSVIGYAFRFPQ
jgi:hypothetical protein